MMTSHTMFVRSKLASRIDSDNRLSKIQKIQRIQGKSRKIKEDRWLYLFLIEFLLNFFEFF